MHYNTEFQYQSYLILREWINLDNIYWSPLSINPNAIHLLEARVLEESQRSMISSPDKIDWKWLSANPNAIWDIFNLLKPYRCWSIITNKS